MLFRKKKEKTQEELEEEKRLKEAEDKAREEKRKELEKERREWLLQRAIFHDGDALVVIANFGSTEEEKAIWPFVEQKIKQGFKLIETPKSNARYIVLQKEIPGQ